MADEAKLHRPIQFLKHWLCDMWSGVVVEKNWALSVDSCLLQALQFLVYSHQFAEDTSQMYRFCQDLESCNGLDQQQITQQ